MVLTERNVVFPPTKFTNRLPAVTQASDTRALTITNTFLVHIVLKLMQYQHEVLASQSRHDTDKKRKKNASQNEL